MDAPAREARAAERQEHAAIRAREEAIALDLIKANPKLTPFALSDLLKRQGVQRSPEWIRRKRLALLAGDKDASSAF